MFSQAFSFLILGSILFLNTNALDRHPNFLPITKLGLETGLTCDECQALFKTVRVFDKTRLGQEVAESLAREICQKDNGFGNCQQFCDELCEGFISEFAPVIWSLGQTATPEGFCQFFKFCPSNQTQFHIFNPVFNDDNKWPVFSRYIFKEVNKVPILQLTDLHLDMYYENNTAVNCGLPQCCRKEYNQTLDGKPVEMSQEFGAFECDTPLSTWNSLLDQISVLNHSNPFKMILLTGDIPSHDIWNQSHSRNLEIITQVLEDLERLFPTTPTYYVFGNHDNFPINLCNTNQSTNQSYNALDYFQHLSTLGWFKWLGPHAQKTFLETGQYITGTPFRNLTILGLNSNLFTDSNFWLAAEDNFQIGNLTKFLNDSLAIYPNTSVYLLNHIPFYSNGMVANVQGAYDLVANEPRIRGIFEGHEHIDNFHLMYDKNNEPSQIAFSPPALVPGQTNPSFRVYHVDPNSWEVMDFDQYRMNLTGSNLAHEVTWHLAYQARNRFKLRDLSAKSWYKFVKTLDDEETFEKYLKEVFHGGLAIPENQTDVLCFLLTDRADLTNNCLKTFGAPLDPIYDLAMIPAINTATSSTRLMDSNTGMMNYVDGCYKT